MLLKGKSAIVTGGNSGIGKAIVLQLAEQGANVAVDYVSIRMQPRNSKNVSQRLAIEPSVWTQTSARSRICNG